MLRLGLVASVAILVLVAFQQTESGDASFTNALPVQDSPPIASAGTGVVAGDADCSGDISAGDVKAMLSFVAHGVPPCHFPIADVNCDGKIDHLDALEILLYLAQLPPVHPTLCGAPGEPVHLGEPTERLIDDAVEAGDIDAETALVYKMYALYGDDRLPAEYAGDPRLGLDHGIAEEAAQALATMSPANQALLQPFLIPPSYEGSWTDRLYGTGSAGAKPQELPPPIPRGDWTSVAGAHARVWWPEPSIFNCDFYCNEEKYASYAETINNNLDLVIWDKLVALMGRSPVSDAGQPFGGPDGKLDIYLSLLTNAETGVGIPGAALAFGETCQNQAAYIIINPNQGIVQLVNTLAHEFMHVLQFAFSPASCSDWAWWAEATATWAMQRVYPQMNVEHGFAAFYLFTTEHPLEEKTANFVWGGNGEFESTDSRHYGAYAFPLYMDMEGNPAMVRTSWEASESQGDSLVAINDVIDGGFKERWPDFAVDTWNNWSQDGSGTGGGDGLSDKFATLDDMVPGAWWLRWYKPDYDVQLEGQFEKIYAQPNPLPHMSIRHDWFRFSDPAIKSVVFVNDYQSRLEDDKVRVQALVKIDDVWKLEDWSKEWVHGFCFDEPGQKLQELVVIVSNATYDDRTTESPSGQTNLVAKNLGCTAIQGVARSHFVDNDGFTVDSETRFRLRKKDGGDAFYTHYELETAQITWDVSGSVYNCTATGEAEQAFPGDGLYSSFTVTDLTPVGGEAFYNGVGGITPGEDHRPLPLIYCPGGGEPDIRQWAGGGSSWFATLDVPIDTENPGHFHGEYIWTPPGDTYWKYTWDMYMVP